MLKESWKIHGSKQFEVKQKIDFAKDAQEVHYGVDTYFFLPSSLQINAHTYSKVEFQRNLKGYVRLRAPNEKLSKISKPGGLLSKLKEFLEVIPEEHTLETETEFEGNLKTFSLSYKRAVRKATNALLAKENVTLKDVNELVDNSKAVIEGYRKLQAAAQKYEKVVESKTYEYCDEFIAIVTAFYMKRITSKLDASIVGKAQDFGQEQIDYLAKTYPIPVPPEESTTSAFILRWSVLKKYVSSNLFLDVRYKKGAPLMIHSIYAVAAALSMIFATLIAFIWQDKYGALSVNLFIAVTIAYIFKDRFKEIFRDWMSRKLRRWLPDRKLIIFREPDIEVGYSYESFDFVDPQTLPSYLTELRKKGHWIPIVHDRRIETVFRFRKDVHLNLKKAKELFKNTNYSLLDIVRFNIGDFLRNIDSKFEELPFFDEEAENDLGEKIYHIYMIRVVKFKDRYDTEMVRIVVNADGIKRLTVVKPLDQGITDVQDDFLQ